MIEAPEDGSGDRVFATLRKAVLARFLLAAQRAVQVPGEVNLLLAGDARLKALNKAYRGKNKATDVLSFPVAGEHGDGQMAGDLAISVETAARQAAEHGHSTEDELRVLMLHGLLHLAGYDHEADDGEMRALESQLRAKLKLPGGLIERIEPDTAGARQRPGRRFAGKARA
ncbi:rRNA maturation RNase YbeY [Terriglobus sp.]|uniref:rRNA maturation RNase YbeY n=1 Tax=Terriglobus sp. TaxID=1889013 RepID=UPI003B00C5CB